MPNIKSYSVRSIFVFLCLWAASASPSSAETILIMNAGLEGEQLSNNDLLRVYAMKKRTWSNGEPVVVYTLPNKSRQHRDFVYNYLRMQSHHLSRLWHKLVFSGTGSKPEVVNSAAEMLEKVANTPGAIGYLDGTEVNMASQSVIAVDAHD
ncbi:hypothetical protein [Halioxenophilus aromaticivorans]